MCKTIQSLVLAFVFLGASVACAGEAYKIDPAHSVFGFSVKHMMVSNVPGQFDQFDGQVIYDPKDLANSKVTVTLQAASVNTRVAKRDEHLRSSTFFDTAKFPTITFVSKKMTATDIVGDLTMKGVTKEVSIPITISGPVNTPMGKTIIGINGSFTLNRQDYGLNWNQAMDQGGVVLSNEVAVNVSVEADK